MSHLAHGLGLLAEIRVGKQSRDTPFALASFIDPHGWAWHRITLSKSKRIRCTCGGSLQINDPKWVCCSHILMLQSRQNITEDPRLIRHDYLNILLVRLTERGKQFFYAKWVAKELQDLG